MTAILIWLKKLKERNKLQVDEKIFVFEEKHSTNMTVVQAAIKEKM